MSITELSADNSMLYDPSDRNITLDGIQEPRSSIGGPGSVVAVFLTITRLVGVGIRGRIGVLRPSRGRFLAVWAVTCPVAKF